MTLNVYVGWDSREDIAYQACRDSILHHCNNAEDVNVIPLKVEELEEAKSYYRSLAFPDEQASTEFAFTRFLVPYLNNYEGYAIFVDCDFIFFKDIRDAVKDMNPEAAIGVVQHDYVPKQSIKMDGQKQVSYPRKNWSSFMVFNCAHPSCGKLTPKSVSTESGAWLHRFEWCDDSEISSLPIFWNWLEGEYDNSDVIREVQNHVVTTGVPLTVFPYAVHYTNGGPWFPKMCEERLIEWWPEYMAYACKYMTDAEIAHVTREQTKFEKCTSVYV